jgi:hypothetical protein
MGICLTLARVGKLREGPLGIHVQTMENRRIEAVGSVTGANVRHNRSCPPVHHLGQPSYFLTLVGIYSRNNASRRPEQDKDKGRDGAPKAFVIHGYSSRCSASKCAQFSGGSDRATFSHLTRLSQFCGSSISGISAGYQDFLTPWKDADPDISVLIKRSLNMPS